MKRDTYSALRLLLALIAVHSMLVGLGMIVMPAGIVKQLGFGICPDRFFPSQGGVFHIVLAVGYGIAAFDVLRFRCLVYYAAAVKAMATLFLFSYVLFVAPIPLVLLSGIGDFLMFLLLWFMVRKTGLTLPEGGVQ